MSVPPARRGGRHIVGAAVIGLILVALYGLEFTSTWRNLSGQAAAIGSERAAVVYARPLTALLGALASAQTAVNAGRPPDLNAIRTAADGVTAADKQVGGELGVSSRWSDLSPRVVDAARLSPGISATLVEVTSLVGDLLAAVADAGGFTVEPDLSTHPLADATFVHIPQIIVFGAQVGAAVDVPGSPVGVATLAIARHQVAMNASLVDAELQAVAAATAGVAVTPQAASRVDAFHSAVAAITPPVIAAPPASGTPPAPSAVTGLQSAAQALTQGLLGQLDETLSSRSAHLVAQQRLAIGAGAGVVVGMIALLVVASPPRSVAPTDGDDTDADEPEPEEPPQIALIGARELLGMEELVHVGRAVRPRARERDDVG